MTVSTVHRMNFFGHDLNKEYRCTIRYLDDSSWETTYFKHEDAQKFFDRVCDHINLVEKDYFGLRFIDEHKQRRWLDLSKSARSQLKKAGKDLENVIICFRIKFYPPDPLSRLNEELTRYQLYLQLRRDLQHGRLYGSSTDEAVLVACILQAERKNMPPDTDKIPDTYRSLIKHGKKGELKSLEQWKHFRALPSTECENRFLTKAAELDTYGIDPHETRSESTSKRHSEPNGEEPTVFIGYNHFGIIAFQGSKKILHLQWAHILRMSYENRSFIVQYVREEKKVNRAFTCLAKKAAKHLWRNALETKIFFTSPSSDHIAPITNNSSVFSRGSKLRFSGRVAREAYEKSQTLHRNNVAVARVPLGTKPESAEVYEGLVATPALHRRPSIYPLPPGAVNGAPGATPAESQPPKRSDSTSPQPDNVSVKSRPNVQAQKSTESGKPSSVAGSGLSKPPPSEEPLSRARTTEKTDELLQEVRERVNAVLDRTEEQRGNGRMEARSPTPVGVNEESQTDLQNPPVVIPQTSTVAKVAVGALIVTTSVLGIFTLFQTNWIALISELVKPVTDVIKSSISI